MRCSPPLVGRIYYKLIICVAKSISSLLSIIPPYTTRPPVEKIETLSFCMYIYKDYQFIIGFTWEHNTLAVRAVAVRNLVVASDLEAFHLVAYLDTCSVAGRMMDLRLSLVVLHLKKKELKPSSIE